MNRGATNDAYIVSMSRVAKSIIEAMGKAEAARAEKRMPNIRSLFAHRYRFVAVTVASLE